MITFCYKKSYITDLYKNSFYLISEEAHPMLFPVELENPEDLPEDFEFEYGEDLSS